MLLVNSFSECPWMSKKKCYRLGMLHLDNRRSQISLLRKCQGIFDLLGETFVPSHPILSCPRPKSSKKSYHNITLSLEHGVYCHWTHSPFAQIFFCGYLAVTFFYERKSLSITVQVEANGCHKQL